MNREITSKQLQTILNLEQRLKNSQDIIKKINPDTTDFMFAVGGYTELIEKYKIELIRCYVKPYQDWITNYTGAE